MTCTFSIGAEERLKHTHGKTMAMIDISPLFTDKVIGFSISHIIGNGWSLSGGTSLKIPFSEDSRTLTHKEDLGISFPEEYGGLTERLKYHLSMDYRPSGTFNGPVISSGITSSETGKTDFRISAGYLCDIIKGLKASLCFSTNIIESFTGDPLSAGRIIISLGYAF